MIRNFVRVIVEKFPRAALVLRTLRDTLDRHDPPKITPWEFTLAGHAAMAAGTFEPQETRLVRSLLQDVDVLVNVGANIGYYCCHALSMGKAVVAVEPVARNLHYLLKNIHNNGWALRAQIFPVALGPRADILELWGGGTGASLIRGWASIPNSYVTRVPVLSMDQVLGNMLYDKRALILVDIEGAEYMMLQGAMKTLVNPIRPIWMMEISTTEHQPAGIHINPNFAATFDVFLKHGYKAYIANERGDEVTPEIVREVTYGRRTLKAHNFLFR